MDNQKIANELVKVAEGLITQDQDLESIMQESGLRFLGRSSSRKGEHWGIDKDGSTVIRIGTRNMALTSWEADRWREWHGSIAVIGKWLNDDSLSLRKMTTRKLISWIKKVKRAPSKDDLKDEFKKKVIKKYETKDETYKLPWRHM